MLQGKTVKISTGGKFVTLEEGIYTLEVVDVNLLEGVISTYAPEGRDLLEYKFVVLDDIEIPAKDGQPASNTRGRVLYSRMTPSLNEKSTMYKLVKGVMGRVPTPSEAANFNPESLVGKQVQAMIVQKPGADGRVWNNIDSYVKATKTLPPFQGEMKDSQSLENSSTPLNVPADQVSDFINKI